MLKVAVVGVGGISATHIPAWERMEDVEVVALCDINPEQMTQYPEKRCYTDMDEMLRKENLDIVDVCAPTYVHVELSRKALEKGIHVVCEKPLALDPADATMLYELAEKNNVLFMVAQVLRFEKNYLILKKLYEEKTYGRLLSLSMHRLCGMPNWNDWMPCKEKSGLSAFDMHIHDLDFCIYAFGAPKNTVQHRTQGPGQDFVHGLYEYEDFFASVEAGWFSAPYTFNAGFRAQFENAILESGNGKFTLLDAEGKYYDLKESAEGPAAINLPPSNGYFNELRYFADCVRDGKPQEIVKKWEVETALTIAKAFG